MIFNVSLIHDCKDTDEFVKIKNQVENSFSIEEENNAVYCYGKEHIISLNNNWFAILNVEGKPLHYELFTLKVLHKIFEEYLYIEDFKIKKQINIVKNNNKGILYCDYSQINKMKL